MPRVGQAWLPQLCTGIRHSCLFYTAVHSFLLLLAGNETVFDTISLALSTGQSECCNPYYYYYAFIDCHIFVIYNYLTCIIYKIPLKEVVRPEITT